jgi:hypothetical protein
MPHTQISDAIRLHNLTLDTTVHDLMLVSPILRSLPFPSGVTTSSTIRDLQNRILTLSANYISSMSSLEDECRLSILNTLINTRSIEQTLLIDSISTSVNSDRYISTNTDNVISLEDSDDESNIISRISLQNIRSGTITPQFVTQYLTRHPELLRSLSIDSTIEELLNLFNLADQIREYLTTELNFDIIIIESCFNMTIRQIVEIMQRENIDETNLEEFFERVRNDTQVLTDIITRSIINNRSITPDANSIMPTFALLANMNLEDFVTLLPAPLNINTTMGEMRTFVAENPDFPGIAGLSMINRSTSSIEFIDKDLDILDDCCICMNESKCQLICNHIVCKSCIEQMAAKKCPMCRIPFTSCYEKIE